MAKPKQPWLAKTHPAKKLRRLVGRWKIEAEIPGAKKPMRGTATFAWIEKDKLLSYKSTGQGKGGMPASHAVIGADDTNDQLTMLYSDERGVTRIYSMTLSKTTWTWERFAPGFSQRCIGTFRGPRRIDAVFYKCLDDKTWEIDFPVRYTKVR